MVSFQIVVLRPFVLRALCDSVVLFRKPLDSTQPEHAQPNKECILSIRTFYKYIRSIPSPLWGARGTKIKFCARFLKYVRGRGKQIRRKLYIKAA